MVKRCPSPHEGAAEIEIRQVFEEEDFGSELTPDLRRRGGAPARAGRLKEVMAARGGCSQSKESFCDCRFWDQSFDVSTESGFIGRDRQKPQLSTQELFKETLRCDS